MHRPGTATVVGALFATAGLAGIPATSLGMGAGSNGPVLFDGNQTGDFDIYIADPDGTRVRNLTRSPGAQESGPAWVMAGRMIAFHRSRPDGTFGLVLRDPGSRREVPVRDTGAPTGSSDVRARACGHEAIVFERVAADGTATVKYVSAADIQRDPARAPRPLVGAVSELGDAPVAGRRPSCNAAGTAVSYDRTVDGVPMLLRASLPRRSSSAASLAAREHIVGEPAASPGFGPAWWSADGRSILYTCPRGPGVAHVCRAQLRSGQVEQLTNLRGFALAPVEQPACGIRARAGFELVRRQATQQRHLCTILFTQRQTPSSLPGLMVRRADGSVEPYAELTGVSSAVPHALAYQLRRRRDGRQIIVGSANSDRISIRGSNVEIATTRAPSYATFGPVSVTNLTVDQDGPSGDFLSIEGDIQERAHAAHALPRKTAQATGARIRLDAGPGADRVEGGSGAEVLVGGSGPDILRGRGGDDRLEGGSGGDDLDGGTGRDLLLGGRGNDLLDGGRDRARDRLFDGPGRDRLRVRVNDSVRR